MNLQSLVPSKGKGRSAGIAVKISGTSLQFNKETCEELGLKDHVQFAFDADNYPDKLFILTNNQDLQRFVLNGQESKNGKRYLSDPVIAKTCKLINGESYPLQKIEGVSCITFDPTREWSAPAKKVYNRKPKTEASEENKKLGAEIAAKKAAKK